MANARLQNSIYILVSVITSIFFIFIMYVIHLANTDQPSIILDTVRAIPYGDKIFHALIFGFLSLGFNIMLQFRQYKHIYIGTLGLSIFVVIEEFTQHFSSHRTFDLIDLLADAIGIALFTYLTLRIHKSLRKSET